MKTSAVAMALAAVLFTGMHAYAQEPGYEIEGQVWGDIYFGTLSAELDDPAMTKLEELYGWLKGHPGSLVLLAGYDDQRTAKDASIELGRKRAEAVRDYLIKLGAEPGLVRTISFGNTHVEVAGEGEEVWSRNRRVRYRVMQPQDTEKMEGRPSGVCQRCKK